jgi:hypothetical protein
MKDAKECSTAAIYLDILLKIDADGKPTTQHYDKRDDFNISINFPYLYSNTLSSQQTVFNLVTIQHKLDRWIFTDT